MAGMVIATTSRAVSGEFASFSCSKSDFRRKQQQQEQSISSNTPTSRTNRLSTKMMLCKDVKHKSIKIPAVHNNKDEGDDGDYIRRKLKQEYNRSSRSFDRSEHPLSRTVSIQRLKGASSRIEMTRTKSNRIYQHQHPSSPGSLTDTNRSSISRNSLGVSNTSHSSSGGGRRMPAQRGVKRSKSSRIGIESEEPSSPGSLSKTNRSNSSFNSCSSSSSSSSAPPLRRVRRARSLDTSARSLPREDYVLTRSSSRNSSWKSEISLSTSASSTNSQQQRSGRNRSQKRLDTSTRSSKKPAKRSATYRLRGKSSSNNSKLSNSSGSTRLSTSISSQSARLSTSIGSGSTITSNQPASITDSSSSTQNNSNANNNNSEGLKRVSWKSDPKTGFSDWTLHVAYRDSSDKLRINVYHLHKNIVAYGNRKSNYILRDIMDNELKEIFDFTNSTELEIKKLLITRSNNKKKSKTGKIPNLTILKLQNETQAAAVPVVLDFMYYSNETNQRMSADQSCNIFKVAEGLKIRALQTAIGEFYEANLSLKNMEEFLTAATKTRANMLLAICKAKIRRMIDALPELSEQVPDEFLPDILDQSYHSIRGSNILDKSGRSRSRKKKQGFNLCSTTNTSTSRCDFDEYAQ